jgi:hypothetical protein
LSEKGLAFAGLFSRRFDAKMWSGGDDFGAAHVHQNNQDF